MAIVPDSPAPRRCDRRVAILAARVLAANRARFATFIQDGQFTEAKPHSDVPSVPVVILGAAEHQAILEVGDEFGVEADEVWLEELQQWTGAQHAWV